MLALLLAGATLAVRSAAAPDPPPLTRPLAALEADLAKLRAEHPEHLRVVAIGRSSAGRTLHAAIAAAFDADEAWRRRPGLAVVAGVDGLHAHGGELALHHLASLLRDPDARALLATRTLIVIPRVAVDGVEARFQDPPRFAAGNLHPRDEDRDRRADEDGPNDVDGDGVIAWMRRRDPAGTHVSFGDEGLLRPANRERGEVGMYVVQREGHDEDGDGRIDEDPPGDVLLDRNFPHGHPEHAGWSGLHPASEPETRAVIDFLLAHRNVVSVLVYGPHDDLRKAPKPPAGRRTEAEPPADESPRSRFRRSRQAPTSWAKADLAVLERWGATYRDLTKAKAVLRAAEEGGTFGEWAYYQYGAFVARACPWAPLDEVEFTNEEKELPEEVREQIALRRLAARRGRGFQEWRPFQHPDLGAVELGGLEQGFGLEPDPETWNALAASHDAFFRAWFADVPQTRFEEPKVTRRADGVFEIEVFLRNDGALPTASAMSEQARMRRAPRVRLELEGCELVAGERVQFSPHLAPYGGRAGLRWVVVRGVAPAHVAVHVDADTFQEHVRIDLP